MTEDRLTTVAFTGHRTYDGQAAAALRATVGELYARGFRTFLCGMAMGFDLAAAEAVLACRDSQTASVFSQEAKCQRLEVLWRMSKERSLLIPQ